MNYKKLKSSAEKITMPDELRQRIITGCENIEQSAKDNDSGEFTNHIYTTDRVKPHYILRTVSAVAACAIVVGGVGAATHLMHKQKSPDTISTEMSEQLQNGGTSPFGDITRYDLTVGTPVNEIVPEGEQKSAVAELINNYNWGEGSVAPDDESFRTDFYYAFDWRDGEDEVFLQIFDDNTARYVRMAVENREEYQYESTYATISTNVQVLVNKHFSIDSQELISAIDEIMMSGSSPFGNFDAYDLDIHYGEVYGADELAGWQKHAIGYYFDSLDLVELTGPTGSIEEFGKIAYQFCSDNGNTISVYDGNILAYVDVQAEGDIVTGSVRQYKIHSETVIAKLDFIITGVRAAAFGDFNTLPYGYVDTDALPGGYVDTDDDSTSIMVIQFTNPDSIINVSPATALTVKQQAVLTDYFFNCDIREWTEEDTEEVQPLINEKYNYDGNFWMSFQYLGENELRSISIAPWGQLMYRVISYEEKDGEYIGEIVEGTYYRIDYDAFKAAYDLAFSDDEPTDDTAVEPTTAEGDNIEISEEPFYMLYRELVYNNAPIYRYDNIITSSEDTDLPHKTAISQYECDSIMEIFTEYQQYITETHDTLNDNDVIYRFSITLSDDSERYLNVHNDNCVSWYDEVNGEFTNIHSYMYTSPQPISEAIDDLYTEISYGDICREYLTENDKESTLTITNWDSPDVEYIKSLPDDYYHIAESADKSDSYVKVTFNTDQDALLGPITFYLDEGGTIIGMNWRE